MKNWYDNPAAIAEFATFLVEILDFNAIELVSVLQKPWKWTVERLIFKEWQHATLLRKQELMDRLME